MPDTQPINVDVSGVKDALAAFKQLQAADSITPSSLGTLIDGVADRVATAATADALTALRTDTATGLSALRTDTANDLTALRANTANDLTALRTNTATGLSGKADKATVNEQLAAKASQADFDKVAHLKNVSAIYRIWEAHNVETVSVNYNARKKADADGSVIDAGGVTLPSATPYSTAEDGTELGNAGVMTAQQATDLRDLKHTKADTAYVDSKLSVKADTATVDSRFGDYESRLGHLTPVLLTQEEYDALVAAGTVSEYQHYAIIEEAPAT